MKEGTEIVRPVSRKEHGTTGCFNHDNPNKHNQDCEKLWRNLGSEDK